MAALYSLLPEDRPELEAEVARAQADHARLTDALARLERERAPHSYRGKVRAQLRANQRHLVRLERMLAEVLA